MKKEVKFTTAAVGDISADPEMRRFDLAVRDDMIKSVNNYLASQDGENRQARRARERAERKTAKKPAVRT